MTCDAEEFNRTVFSFRERRGRPDRACVRMEFGSAVPALAGMNRLHYLAVLISSDRGSDHDGIGRPRFFHFVFSKLSTDCSRRFAAFSQQPSSTSQPIAAIPQSRAAIKVEPLPQNGSNTNAPAGQE